MEIGSVSQGWESSFNPMQMDPEQREEMMMKRLSKGLGIDLSQVEGLDMARMKDFLDALRDAKQNGGDISSLIDLLPDSIIEAAEEQDIDLEEQLQEMINRAPEHPHQGGFGQMPVSNPFSGNLDVTV